MDEALTLIKSKSEDSDSHIKPIKMLQNNKNLNDRSRSV